MTRIMTRFFSPSLGRWGRGYIKTQYWVGPPERGNSNTPWGQGLASPSQAPVGIGRGQEWRRDSKTPSALCTGNWEVAWLGPSLQAPKAPSIRASAGCTMGVWKDDGQQPPSNPAKQSWLLVLPSHLQRVHMKFLPLRTFHYTTTIPFNHVLLGSSWLC